MGLIPGPPYQDYVVISGIASPGLAVIKGADTPRKWDIREAYGASGASTVLIGRNVSQFDIDFYAWEPEHFVFWELFKKAIELPETVGRATGLQPSLSIQHPTLSEIGILSVGVKNLTAWEQDSDGGGLWMRTLSLVQFKKPIPFVAKQLEGPPGDPLVVAPPVNPQEIIIETLSSRVLIAKAEAGG